MCQLKTEVTQQINIVHYLFADRPVPVNMVKISRYMGAFLLCSAFMYDYDMITVRIL